jgi:hypothetical protein
LTLDGKIVTVKSVQEVLGSSLSMTRLAHTMWQGTQEARASLSSCVYLRPEFVSGTKAQVKANPQTLIDPGPPDY